MKTYFWFEVSSNFLIVTVGDYNRNTPKYKFYFVLKRLYNEGREQSLLIGEICQEKDSEENWCQRPARNSRSEVNENVR